MEPFGFVRLIRYGNADSRSRREPVKKAISQGLGPAFPMARATIPAMSEPTRPRRRPASTVLALAATLAILVAACGTSDPSASPSPSAAPTAAPVATPSTAPTAAPSGSPSPGAADAIYDTIEAQVAEIRGLPAKRPVPRQFITADEFKAMIVEQFDEEAPPSYVAANERLYKALGLIPSDSNLRDLNLDLFGGGAVVGVYRNDQGKLYVVSKTGELGPNEKFYFSHEYDHALQDQNFTVFKDQDGILDQSDRILARQAVYEGDATLLMTQWGAGNLTQSDFLEILAASANPEVIAVLDRTPAILRTPLEFPYTTGFGFVQTVNGSGGWDAVNDLYARMPESTEQILHPDKYAAAEAPVKVALPADLATRLGTGWKVAGQDTLGELQIGIWLREGGVQTATADAAAAGWGGDRLAVLEGPGGDWAVAIETAWDTKRDADEFDGALSTALGKARGVARTLPGANDKTRWVVIANDATTSSLVTEALSLPN
jgi:hypothetical protein